MTARMRVESGDLSDSLWVLAGSGTARRSSDINRWIWEDVGAGMGNAVLLLRWYYRFFY